MTGPPTFRVGDTVTCNAGRSRTTRPRSASSSRRTTAPCCRAASARPPTSCCRPRLRARTSRAARSPPTPAAPTSASASPPPRRLPQRRRPRRLRRPRRPRRPAPTTTTAGAACEDTSKLKFDMLAVTATAPRSARRGRSVTAHVIVHGLRATPFVVDVSTWPKSLSGGFWTKRFSFGSGYTDLEAARRSACRARRASARPTSSRSSCRPRTPALSSTPARPAAWARRP